MNVQGLFITFEGPDGAGKSTQVQKLAHYLQGKEISYIHTREPGGTAISDKIRSLILDPEHSEMVNETEVLLYAASRAQHVREKIIPALEEGKVVLCDRFVDASIAYQGFGLGIGQDKISEINRFATGGLKPSRTYLIDLSPEEGRKRMMERYKAANKTEQFDRIEQKELAYHETVRNGFHQIYETEKDRIYIIDGRQSVEEIFQQIKDDFDSICSKQGLKMER
ncbi:dTMP kinase [Bacillus taeanensis]|uniref:Thymidylate kinase n=1 Tax=Bacillus taeanensis TaxID=273032 RepID=A0A366XS79_9BACI|nr:dTMP kinase [Bacillus taeanensis]